MAFRIFDIPCTPVGGAGAALVTVTRAILPCKIHGYGIKITGQTAPTVRVQIPTYGGLLRDLYGTGAAGRLTGAASLPFRVTGELPIDAAAVAIAQAAGGIIFPYLSGGGGVVVTVTTADAVANGIVVALFIEV